MAPDWRQSLCKISFYNKFKKKSFQHVTELSHFRDTSKNNSCISIDMNQNSFIFIIRLLTQTWQEDHAPVSFLFSINKSFACNIIEFHLSYKHLLVRLCYRQAYKCARLFQWCLHKFYHFTNSRANLLNIYFSIKSSAMESLLVAWRDYF